MFLFLTVFITLGCKVKDDTTINILETKPIYNLPEKRDLESEYDKYLMDIELLNFYLINNYINYESMVKKGYSIDGLKEYFTCNYKETVDELHFAELLNNYFKNYIDDGHFSINLGEHKLSTLQKTFLFFADTFVEKKEGKFYVHSSENTNIPVGANIKILPKYLFMYPAKGKNIYRLGILSNEYVNVLTEDLLIDGGTVKETFYKIDNSKLSLNYIEYETDNTTYIQMPSFALSDENYFINDFILCGEKYRDKQNIIIDLRGNTGGEKAVFSNFLINLENEPYVDSYIFGLTKNYGLASPDINVNELNYGNTGFYEYFESNYKNQKVLFREKNTYPSFGYKSNFKGKIYFLIDKQTASSSEIAVWWSKKLFKKNCIVIGQNSSGAVNYQSSFYYELPHSKVAVNLCSTYIKNLDVKEGVGIKPDFWTTSEDLYTTLRILLQDKDLYKIGYILKKYD